MEHYIGLAIIVFIVSTAAYIWLEIYRARVRLEQEVIKRKLAEYELREMRKRAEINDMSVDELIERRRNSGKKRPND